MIVRSYRFLDLETPVEFMTDWITLSIISSCAITCSSLPRSRSTWKLTIGGEVEKPLTLTLADLQKVPVHSVTNAMECAGNGPVVAESQSAGNSVGQRRSRQREFSGPSLKVVLEKAGVKDTGNT